MSQARFGQFNAAQIQAGRPLVERCQGTNTRAPKNSTGKITLAVNSDHPECMEATGETKYPSCTNLCLYTLFLGSPETSNKRDNGVEIPETVSHGNIPVYQIWSVCTALVFFTSLSCPFPKGTLLGYCQDWCFSHLQL